MVLRHVEILVERRPNISTTHDASLAFGVSSVSELSPFSALFQNPPVDGEGGGKCVMYDGPELQHRRQTATGGVGFTASQRQQGRDGKFILWFVPQF